MEKIKITYVQFCRALEEANKFYSESENNLSTVKVIILPDNKKLYFHYDEKYGCAIYSKLKNENNFKLAHE